MTGEGSQCRSAGSYSDEKKRASAAEKGMLRRRGVAGSDGGFIPSSEVINASDRKLDVSNRLFDPSNRLFEPSNRLFDPSNRLFDPSHRSYDPSGQALWYTPSGRKDHPPVNPKMAERQRLMKARMERMQQSVKIARSVRSCLYYTLALTSLIFIGEAIYLVWWMGTTTSTESSAWVFHPLPYSYGFDHFGISSNSELCNEIARRLYKEDFSTLQIAVGVAMCLTVSEPHQSDARGLGASVFLSNGGNDCSHMSSFTKEDENNVTTSISVLELLYDTLSDDEIRGLKARLQSYKYFPISRGYAEYLRRLNTEIVLLSKYNSSKHLFTEENFYAVPVEGDLFPVSASFEELFNRLGEGMDDKSKFRDLAGPLEVEKRETQRVGLSMEEGAVCYHEDLDTTYFLREIERISKTGNFSGQFKKMKTPETSSYFYQYAFSIVRFVTEQLTEQVNRFVVQETRATKRQDSFKTWVPPHSGNFFTLFDVRNETAIAFSQTTRSSGNLTLLQPFVYSSPTRDMYDFLKRERGRVVSLGRGNNLYKKDTASAIEVKEGKIHPVFFDSSGAAIIPNGV
ncbi:hypothetical protein Q1695_015717 [Nippostrongylus brasiliensis]|nr:hypothetical protein Q1695_015717 [Nippostrongylus brasiliensis]